MIFGFMRCVGLRCSVFFWLVDLMVFVKGDFICVVFSCFVLDGEEVDEGFFVEDLCIVSFFMFDCSLGIIEECLECFNNDLVNWFVGNFLIMY